MTKEDTIKLFELLNEYNLDLIDSDKEVFDNLYEKYSRQYDFGEYSKKSLENKALDAKMKSRFERVHFCPLCPQKPYNILGLGSHCKQKHPELVKSEKSKLHKKDSDIDFDDVVFEISKLGSDAREKYLVNKIYKFYSECKKDNSAIEYIKNWIDEDEFCKELLRSFSLNVLEDFNEKIDELGKFDPSRLFDRKAYWIQRNGNPIKIKSMDNQHLENTLRLIFRNNIVDENPIGLEALTKEKRKRIQNNLWYPGTDLGNVTENYLKYCKKEFGYAT